MSTYDAYIGRCVGYTFGHFLVAHRRFPLSTFEALHYCFGQGSLGKSRSTLDFVGAFDPVSLLAVWSLIVFCRKLKIGRHQHLRSTALAGFGSWRMISQVQLYATGINSTSRSPSYSRNTSLIRIRSSLWHRLESTAHVCLLVRS